MNRQLMLRLRNRALVAVAIGALTAVNYTHVSSGVQLASTMITEAQPAYKQSNGEWTTVNLPAKFKVNGIHSVLLATGKVLVVAGSGNNVHHFDAGTFNTTLWDPPTTATRRSTLPWTCSAAATRSCPTATS